MISESVLKKIEDEFDGIKLMMKYVKENISSEEEQPPHVIVAIIAKEFKYDLADYSYQSMYYLDDHILAKGQHDNTLTIQLLEEVVFEITKGSIVQLSYSFNRMQFQGVVLDTAKSILLKINGKMFDSRYFDEHQLDKMIDNLRYLFNDEGSKRAQPFDKLQAVFQVFKSGRNNDVDRSYGILIDTANEIANYQDNDTSHQRMIKYNDSVDFIIQKYLEYLWSKNDGTLSVYILSFDSFVARNKDAWMNNLDSAEESLNLFLEEHRQAVDIFQKLEEPHVKYEKETQQGPPQEVRRTESRQVG